MESIKYGIQNPSSDFDRRANDTNAPGSDRCVKGKAGAIPQGSTPGKQTKGHPAGKK